jgi:hypothetical protein
LRPSVFFVVAFINDSFVAFVRTSLLIATRINETRNLRSRLFFPFPVSGHVTDNFEKLKKRPLPGKPHAGVEPAAS